MRRSSGEQSPPSSSEITMLMQQMADLRPESRAELFSLLYPELKRIAEARMRGERWDHTLQPTALVNEFFLELARMETVAWQSRAHFLAVASQVMRRVLIDYARSHAAGKRGGGAVKLDLAELNLPADAGMVDILEINDLLDLLAAEEPRMAQVVELRCYGGLTYTEVAEVLSIDERTAKRDWQVARAWLMGHMTKGTRHDR